MGFVSDTDKQRIEAAIARAEAATRGEFVTVVAGAADDYLYVSVLWSALLALATPGLVLFSGVAILSAHVYLTQIAVFLATAVLLRWRPLLMRVIPRSLRQRRAHRLALEQFYSHNLHRTRERTGVLLFVSVAERYVEVIADKGIDDAVDNDAWRAIVDAFVARVRAGEVGDGFVEAVDACGALLAGHFPADGAGVNELPNHLVEI